MDVRRSIRLPLLGLALFAGLAQAHGPTHNHDQEPATEGPISRFNADKTTTWDNVLAGCVNPKDLQKSYLLSGLGGTRYPLVTATEGERVGAFYSQGMALQYGFNFAEATRAFYQASLLDKGSVMPYWGIALSANSNINSNATGGCNLLAWRAALKAQENAGQRLEDKTLQERFGREQLQREYDYTNAFLKLYRVEGNDVVFDDQTKQAYAQAMQELANKYPGDLDAATLHADALLNLTPWQWWKGNAASAAGVEPTDAAAKALQILNKVLIEDQQHTGANHFYIHAIEESPFSDSGLPMAERFRTQNPAIGHLVHMASHIYQRTGNNNLASVTNYTAVAVDRAYVAQANPQSPYALHYLGHNIHFLTWTLSIEGRQNETLEMVEELVDNTTEFAALPFLCKEFKDEIQVKSDYFYAVPYYFSVRFQDWQARDRIEKKINTGLATINQTCKAEDPEWKDLTAPYTQTMRAYASTYEQLSRPGLSEADAQKLLSAWLQQVNDTLTEDFKKTAKPLAYGNNAAIDLLRIANLILLNQAQASVKAELNLQDLKEASAKAAGTQAKALADDIASLTGNKGEQILAAWTKAVAVQDSLNYNEPPDWYYTLRESLGYAQLELQKYAEAEQSFRDDLINNRLSGRSLNGLKLSLEKQGKPVPALLDEQLSTAWRNATISAAPLAN
ncbi:hypothetical protein NRB16_19620 [Pseudomonas sp. LJDD11]|uniref:hypothetical protein n=1 Tax=Pseudomonas sp. LJDD11 TaxID=2931984 RepID=UPI00211C5C57|nr:hypothetical protein [Pseudomonas sp. LJDD11]MCQ9425726.1 hypothetical protein [Pseudomonas sp. LJDD11]